MQYKVLTDFCDINMGQSPDSESYNDKKDGMPFYQGNADFGPIHPLTRVWCSSPIKVAHTDDILISVRAPIGALNIANEECCIGRGLASLSPKKNNTFTKFLFYALKSKSVELNNKGTGSTFKAISKKILEETFLPYYSLSDQHKIVATLDQVNDLISLRNQQLEQLDLLVKSRFVEMFGDPIHNSKNWEVLRLSNLGELNRGVSKFRPRNASELLGGKYPLIQTGDVTNADTYITYYNSTYSELGLKQSRLWKKGTLCITIAANIAHTAILDFDACFPDSVVGFIPSGKTNTLFIHHWFTFFQKILEEQAPQSAQKNINLGILSELVVIVPPLALQTQFADFVQQVDKAKASIKQSLEQLETLKASLMQQYFG